MKSLSASDLKKFLFVVREIHACLTREFYSGFVELVVSAEGCFVKFCSDSIEDASLEAVFLCRASWDRAQVHDPRVRRSTRNRRSFTSKTGSHLVKVHVFKDLRSAVVESNVSALTSC